MAEFLNRFEVTKALQQLIEDATEQIILISPYFKLNDQIKRSLSKHKNDKKFFLVIVYGKNEENKMKSLSDDDLRFLKSFPNVEIRYHKRLHAKMYLNESTSLLTSMNLHDYSMNENIEFGILAKTKFTDFFTTTSIDSKASEFAEYIIDKSEIEFAQSVEVKKSFFGLFTSHGDTKVEVEKNRYGYCIRTRVQIPFNPKHPYSADAFHSWNQYKNPNYSEKYCHGCGNQHKSSMYAPLCNNCSKN